MSAESSQNEAGKNWFRTFLERPLSAILLPSMLTYWAITCDVWPFIGIVAWLTFCLATRTATWPSYADLCSFVEKKLTGTLDPWLLAVSSAGAVAVGVFAFDSPSIRPFWWSADPWANWHRAATAWTLLLFMYQIPKFDSAVLKGLFWTVWVAALAAVAFVVWPDNKTSAEEYIAVTALAAILSAVINGALAAALFEKGEPHAPNELRRTYQSLWFSDIPVIIACLLIWAYASRAKLPEHFVAGVLSFQLLTSKAVFLLIETDAANLPFPQPALQAKVVAAP